MIKQLEFDRANPIWAYGWDEGSKGKPKIYLFSIGVRHYFVVLGGEQAYLGGAYPQVIWYTNIEFSCTKILTAQTCPRRPVLRHPDWAGEEYYPNILFQGLSCDGKLWTWLELATKGYEVSGC